MSQYSTISTQYHVHEVNDDGDIIKTYSPIDPEYNKGIDAIAKCFNDMHLEKYIDDEEAKRILGYEIKDRIRSIRMYRIRRTDDKGYPYVRIDVKGVPKALKMTRKVQDFLDDYLAAQFSDGWGESAFYPYNYFDIDGKKIAVE